MIWESNLLRSYLLIKIYNTRFSAKWATQLLYSTLINQSLLDSNNVPHQWRFFEEEYFMYKNFYKYCRVPALIYHFTAFGATAIKINIWMTSLECTANELKYHKYRNIHTAHITISRNMYNRLCSPLQTTNQS